MNADLFSDSESCHVIDLQGADILFYPNFFDDEEADYYFNELLRQLEWTQHRIRLYGKEYDVPRLSAWYADQGKSYGYSGLRCAGLPWIALLKTLMSRVNALCSAPFNSVLANRYRNGADGVGWHADDEPELGSEPVIASLSFGQHRCFQLKHKTHKSLKKSFILPHGSLLIMQGKTQANWLHQIPKSSKAMQERINLTFRHVS
ncbi:MAG: alpha-ketoglutarate-dependent dioxygenase AlkB [Gammaproteobacteria bacterium]|nr:alpha-ketoglutarate-dependent dioxygenase AlkB [Gammaproteobacteria bacterium]